MCPQPTSDFETAVLQWIAKSSGDSALQEQLAGALVVDREYTVVGCYSNLLVPMDSPASTAA